MSLPLIITAQPPLTPDEAEAREWALRELAKTEYQQAKPNFIDKFFESLWNSLEEFFRGEVFTSGGINPWAILLILLLIGAVVALVLFGRPRAIARRQQEPGAVFLDDDPRTARELREAADAAARVGDWRLAVTERYRAISRSLSDRTLITLRPGTTAQTVANLARRVFPNEAPELHFAADAFDDVRYLNGDADRGRYERVASLDHRLEQARPKLEAAPLHVGTGSERA